MRKLKLFWQRVWEDLSPTTKRYIVSSLLTFLSTFLSSTALLFKSFDVDTATGVAIFGGLAVCFRMALKVAFESIFKTNSFAK